MQALLPHTPDHPHPSTGTPRFTGDWVEAAVVLEHGGIRVDTAEGTRLLIAEDFETLDQALAVAGPVGRGTGARTGVQYNQTLGQLLVPGGHERAGRSFFAVRPAEPPAT